MLFKLAGAVATPVDYRLNGNPIQERPLVNTRRVCRYLAVEGLYTENRETVIPLIDGMIA